MSERYVLVSDLAGHLGLKVDTLRKKLPKMGFKYSRQQRPSDNQWVRVVAVEDAKRILASVKDKPVIVSLGDILNEQEVK